MSNVNKAMKLIRTSPHWTHTSRLLHRVTSRRQLAERVRFGFSRQPCTKSAVSPSSDVQTRRYLICWKIKNEVILLVLVLAPEESWIILCDHEKVLPHLFGPSWAFVSCRAFNSSPPPKVAPNPSSPLFSFKHGSHHCFSLGFI